MLRKLLFACLVVAACSSRQGDANAPQEQCRDSAGDDVEMAARTAGRGVETGVKTGVEGVKTFGKATGGLIRGGSREARQEWNEGAAETDAVASEGANKTRKEASKPECP
jgi:hypothetical protein